MQKKNKKNASYNNNILKTSKRILTLFTAFLMLTTVFSSAVGSAKIGDRINNLKEKIETVKEETNNLIENLKNVEIQDDSNENTITTPSKPTLLSSIKTLATIKESSDSTLNFYTNYNGIEKTTKLKIFGTTEISLDNDDDKDISAKLTLLPGIERPFALSINFGLTIKKLSGFDDNDASLKAYAEVVFPGIVNPDGKGDKIYFGYDSPAGDRIPDSCVITYKYVPYLINPLKKPDHKLVVSPSSDVAGKENLNLILSYVDVDGSQEDEFKVAYSPAAETRVTLGRENGKSIEFERERASGSKVDLYLTHKKNGNTSYVYVYDLPSHVSFVLDIGRDGKVEFDTNGEQASEIGVCDDFVKPTLKLYFTDLPTKAGVEWHRRLLRGEVEVNVYREGTEGVYFNALITGENGTKFYGSFRVKADQETPFSMTFGDRRDGEAEISLATKSFEISDFEGNLFIPGKGTYSLGFDQFIKEKEGHVKISLSIKGRQETQTTLDVKIEIVNGVEIHGVKIGFNGSWSSAPPPFDNIVIDGDFTFQFSIGLEGISIKIGKGWGYISIQGSITFSTYYYFNFNDIEGGIIGTITIGSASTGLNISWYTVSENGEDVVKFNIEGLDVGLQDFHVYYGDMLDLKIPSLSGSIQLIDACRDSGEFLFELEGGSSSLDLDFDVNFGESTDFQLRINVDDFHIDLPDTSATFSVIWTDGNMSNIRFYAIANINLEIVDLDLELVMSGERVLLVEDLNGYVYGHAGIDVDLSLPLNMEVNEDGTSIDLTEDTFGFVFEDVEAYIHIGDLNLTIANMSLGEVELHVDVTGSLSISVLGVYIYNIPDWSEPAQGVYWNWLEVVIGIDATNSVFDIVSVRIANFNEIIKMLGFVLPFQVALDLDDTVINGYSEFSVKIGGFTQQQGGIPGLCALGIRFENDPGATIYIDRLSVFVPEFALYDAPLTVFLQNATLAQGVLDMVIPLWLRNYALNLSDGTAIRHFEMGAELPGYASVTAEIDQPITYLNLEFNDEFNNEPAPYNSYILIDTLNETISADVYIRVTPEFINIGVDYINQLLDLSLPHLDIQYDQGIRFNGITLKADKFKVFMNETCPDWIGGFLQVYGDGKIWWLKEGEWTPLFGDLSFSITVMPGHIIIEFLKDCNGEIIDFYNEQFDITIYGLYTAHAGLRIDIYFDKISGTAQLLFSDDMLIEDFEFSVGNTISVTADKLDLDVDSITAGAAFEFNDLGNATITFDAKLNGIYVENLGFYANFNYQQTKIMVDGNFDLSLVGEIELETDLSLSTLKLNLDASGSASITGLDVNVNNGAFIVSANSLYLSGYGTVIVGEDIVVDAGINSLGASNLYISGSMGNLRFSGTIDASAAAKVYVKSDLALSNVYLQVSGGGTLKITGLNLDINNGDYIVSCISLTITGNGYLKLAQTVEVSAYITYVNLNTLYIHISETQVSFITIDCDITLSATGALYLRTDFSTYLEGEVVGSASAYVDGDITANIKDIIEVTVKDIHLTVGEFKLGGSSVNKYVEFDSDATLSWSWGKIKFVQQGFSFEYEGLSSDVSLKGGLRIDWTGTIYPVKPTSLKIDCDSLTLYSNLLIVTVNDNEIFRVGGGGEIDGIIYADQIYWDSSTFEGLHLSSQTNFDISIGVGSSLKILDKLEIVVDASVTILHIQGDLDIDLSQNYEISLESTNGLQVSADATLKVNDFSVSLEGGVGLYGDITFKWNYMPSQAKCAQLSSTNGFDTYIPRVTLNSEIILEIDIDMQPGSSLEYRDWYTSHDGLTSSQDVIFDGGITVTLFRITRGGDTAEISGTLTGNNAHLAIGKDSTGKTYIIKDSDGTSTASGLTFSNIDGDISGTLQWNGDLKTSFDTSWGDSGNGKSIYMISQNGYQGTSDINLGNFHIYGARTLNAGNAEFSFDIPIGQNVIKKVEMDTNPTTFISSMEFKVLYGNAGIRFGPNSFYADDFVVYWDFILPGLEWYHDGSIGGSSNPTIEATETGGASWDQIWPITADNEPPVADPGGPYSQTTEYAILFDASDSYDPEGTAVLEYKWEFGDGEYTVWNENWETYYHRYNEGGTYTVTLKVREKSNPLKIGEATTTATITNQHPPEVYIHVYGPYGLWLARSSANGGGQYSGGETDVQYKFSADGNLLHPQYTDAYFGIKAYRWYKTSSWEDWTYSDTISDRYYSWSTAGTYSVKLEVMDNHNVSRLADMLVIISTAVNPIADAGGAYSGIIGDLINLDGSNSQPVGGLEYRWDWTNNGIYDTAWSDTPYESYSYSEGTYTVKLQVRKANNHLLTSSDTSTVQITPAQGYIKGHVYNSGGSPLSSAHVVTDHGSYSTYTDTNGYYILTVTPDTYILQVTKTNYVPESSGSITVANGVTKTVDFYMDESANLYGYVRDTSGNGIGGAKVQLDNGQYAYTISAGNLIGQYTFNWEVSPGTYDITASKSGYISYTKYNYVISQGANSLDLTLQQSQSKPSVSTLDATSIASTSATLNGNLVSMGGTSSCYVWFEYGTTTSYGSSTSHSTKTSTGSFSSTVSSLSSSTTYHYRAVASNSQGTSYGSDKTFTTSTCFLAGTKIMMADDTLKNIEDVKVGEMVKTFDQEEQLVTIGRVSNVFHHTSSDQMTSSYLVINNVLKVTSNHPINVNNHWVNAGEIKIGDKLQDINGKELNVNSIEWIFDTVPTYNLEVETYHTYYAENILVHNKPAPGWVRPDTALDTIGWYNENNAIDTSTSTYSHYYKVGDTSTTDYALTLKFSTALSCDQIKIDAENMDQLSYMTVDLYYGGSLIETCFFSNWNDHSYTYESFDTIQIDKVEITFYLSSGFGYGVYQPRVYDFQVYRV